MKTDVNVSYGYYSNSRLVTFSTDINVDIDYYIKLKKLLRIEKLADCPLIRIGDMNKDGGYIMADDFEPGGIAYSFGISNDVSWDTIMARYNYDIFMYDHTINKLPSDNENFHYFKEGISGHDMENYPTKSLKYFINRNGHNKTKNLILKMDVEGAEWEFLETVDAKTLKQFDQIVFELHNIVKPSGGNKILESLEKLNKTHCLIHLHGNNSGVILKVGDTVFPDVLEATYVNRDKYYTFEDNLIVLPTALDKPNDIGRPDIIMGLWNTPITFNN